MAAQIQGAIIQSPEGGGGVLEYLPQTYILFQHGSAARWKKYFFITSLFKTVLEIYIFLCRV